MMRADTGKNDVADEEEERRKGGSESLECTVVSMGTMGYLRLDARPRTMSPTGLWLSGLAWAVWGGALRVIGQCDGRVEDATAVRSPRLGERPACPPPERWRST